VRPTVSVCIPTRNQAHYLGRAFESVLAQTYEDFEIVVCDDASTDRTPEVIASFADRRVRTLRHARQVGIAANRNTCVDAARGRYVAWLDSDDEWLPQMLERQVATLDARPEVGFVHGSFELIDEDGRRLPDWAPAHPEDTVFEPVTAFDELVIENVVAPTTVVARRERLQEAGPFFEGFRASGEDWDMWLRLALRAAVAYTAAPVGRYRIHGESSSSRATGGAQRVRLDARIVQRALGERQRVAPDAPAVAHRARAAVAARAILQLGDLFTSGRRVASLAAWQTAARAAPWLLRLRAGAGLPIAVACSSEVGVHRHSRALLVELRQSLAGTRLGDRLDKLVAVDPSWQETLRAVADVVGRVTPPSARVVAVDKWDPTLLELSARRGGHFPDRRLLPGYPRSSDEAIAHLEELRRRGAEYLVLPPSAFWWLDYYSAFAEYLERRFVLRWCDRTCVLYELTPSK
jgi:GT2 family glycosyltransferase